MGPQYHEVRVHAAVSGVFRLLLGRVRRFFVFFFVSNSQGSSGSGSSSDSCWSSSSGNNKCAVANSTYVGEALAKCLTTKLRTRDYLREIAILKSVIGGSKATATDADIGAATIDGTGYYTCEGSDGYKYDPFNDCPEWEYDSESGTYECKRYCEGVEDCKDKCLSSKTCNWKPWEYSDGTWGPTSEENCLDEDLGDNFCASTNEWGGIEDITELGYCSPTTGIVDEYGYISTIESERKSRARFREVSSEVILLPLKQQKKSSQAMGR